jgi:hypothetical protein
MQLYVQDFDAEMIGKKDISAPVGVPATGPR